MKRNNGIVKYNVFLRSLKKCVVLVAYVIFMSTYLTIYLTKSNIYHNFAYINKLQSHH